VALWDADNAIQGRVQQWLPAGERKALVSVQNLWHCCRARLSCPLGRDPRVREGLYAEGSQMQKHRARTLQHQSTGETESLCLGGI